MLAHNTRLKERYRILHNIGGGGFGYVYKAIDEVFGCSVAIKETREEIANREKLRKAFEREAKLLRSFKHDSLPRVTDYFFHGQAQFLVMDFIEGEDLAALLTKRLQQGQGPFTCLEFLPWADKILSALEYLHTRPEPIIHRDIKPANIKLADDGGIYLLDFGLAKGATGQMTTIIEGETSSSTPGFTREYAPLEQLQDTATEPQSDIYALGATLYHLLTGQLPISAFRRDETLRRWHADPLRPAHEVNPAIPLAVSEVISQALALRWWERIASIKEMRAALNQACGEMTATQPSLTTQPASKTASTDPKDKLLILPLPLQHKPTSPDIPQPALSPANTPARLRPPRRPWLIAAIALLLLTSLGFAVRLAFPHWFTPTGSIKPATQAAQPTENLPPPKVVTPTDLKFKLGLSGHTGIVWSVAFSPDDRLAASASEDGAIILWDTRTWRSTSFSPLKGHNGAVYSVAFSLPEGKILASGGHDKTIKLWDTQTGKLIKVLEQDKPVTRLVFSPDGNILASCDGVRDNGNKEIRLWYAHNDWKSKILEGHADTVLAVAFSPDSRILISASYDKTLRLWNLNNDGQVESDVLMSYDHFLTTLAFSGDGKYIACGSSDNTIKLWVYQPQPQKWEELKNPLVAHKAFITSIAFSPNNKTLVSASADTTIRLWDIATQASTRYPANRTEVQVPKGIDRPKETFNSVAFSPDGQILITGGQDSMVRVWQ